MNRNVLILSYYFPPGGGVGAFRAAKFVKYLPDFNWNPYVVCLPQDRQSQFLTGAVDTDQFASIAEIPQAIEYVDVTGLRPTKPLGGIRWLPSLLRRVPAIIEAHDIDVVFHTGSPFIPLLAANWVRRRTDVSYIVDLRDPWYVSKTLFENTKSISNPIWRQINRTAERSVMKNADHVVLNTANMESLYRDRYPSETEKFSTIPNGFDPDDYDHEPDEPFNGLRIVYPGRFRQNSGVFLDALKRFEGDTRIQLVHFGRREYPPTKRFYETAEQSGLRDWIDSRGYTELDSVVSSIKGSDLGLVITRPEDPTHIPTKIFDYLACDIPVLALDSPDGALAHFLDPIDHAYRADHDDVERIESILCQILENRPQSLGDEQQRNRYSRRELTGQLAALLEEHSQ